MSTVPTDRKAAIDRQCFELAGHFLKSEEVDSLGNRWDLADHIQSAVECWFSLLPSANTP